MNKNFGLAFIKDVMNGKYPPPPVCDIIPMQMITAEEGLIEFTMTADQRHLNPMGGVHGGVIATYIDSVAGCVVNTVLKEGEAYGTIDLNIKYFKPVPTGKELRCIGKLLNRSSNLAATQASLNDEEGKCYAHGTATFAIFKSKPSSE